MTAATRYDALPVGDGFDNGRRRGGIYTSALALQWRGIVALLGWSVLEGLPAFFGGRVVGTAVDQGFAAGEPFKGALYLGLFGLVMVVGAVGSRLVYARLGDVVEPVRDALVAQVVHGVLRSKHKLQPDASAVARITRHVEVIRDATAGLLVQARGLLVTTVAALVGMFTTAEDLAWLVAFPVALSLLLFGLLLPSLARKQREVVLADERTAEVAGAALVGIRDVAACDARSVAAQAVQAEVERQARAAVSFAKSGALRTLTVAVGGIVPLFLVLLAAPKLVASGQLTTGAVLAAVVYVSASVQPALQGLADTTGTVVLRLAVALRRLAECAGEPESPAGAALPAGDSVVVRGLTFRWGAAAEPVVKNLNLVLRTGDHLAIVGPSGIGKSTVAGLLTGLMPPEEGSVTLGAATVHEIPPVLRHELIALIPQETYLFNGTVRENLALLRTNASDDELLAAVRAVGAEDIVHRLGGLDGGIGHAAEGLSAGEAQLLALARVYATHARVIILDEATSHLDPAAEARVELAFATRGGILVVIAHRLSSALRADQVLVLDGGAPLMGAHADLLTSSTLYGQLMLAWDPTHA